MKKLLDLPDKLAAELKKAAKKNRRSLNAEIVVRLETSTYLEVKR